MEGYYAYWETVGFKLAHLWGFQWADHFLPICHFRLHTGHGVYRKIHSHGTQRYWPPGINHKEIGNI